MNFCFGCMQKADHTASCPQCGRGYLTCEMCPHCGYESSSMKQPIVTLRINPLPQEMAVYNFPCGETNCPKLGEMELEIRTLESEFKMAVCTKHAKELSYDLHKSIAVNIE